MEKKNLITLLVAIVGILMITFFVKDWLVFYQCGAVEQCLVENSNYQNIAKFFVTTIMTVVVFFIGEHCLCVRDRKFLQAGFASALLADFCLKILHNYSHFLEHRSDYTLLGICFFMITQALFIYRHTRTSDTDNSVPKIIIIPFAVMFLTNALHLFRIFEGPTVPIIATYASFLFCSLYVACQVPKKGYFPAKNAKKTLLTNRPEPQYVMQNTRYIQHR